MRFQPKLKSWWTSRITYKISSYFMSKRNCVFKFGCVKCNAFYVVESSRVMLTSAKDYLWYTNKPPNNSVKLDISQYIFSIAVHVIFNNHQMDIRSNKMPHKGFSNYKQKRVAEALHIMHNPNTVNRKGSLNIHPTWTTHSSFSVWYCLHFELFSCMKGKPCSFSQQSLHTFSSLTPYIYTQVYIHVTDKWPWPKWQDIDLFRSVFWLIVIYTHALFLCAT